MTANGAEPFNNMRRRDTHQNNRAMTIAKHAKRLARRIVGSVNAITHSASKERNNVRILTYHRVNDNERDTVAVRLEDFDWHMEYLASHYPVVSLLDAPRIISNKEKRTYVVVTFDDGYSDNFINALPILEKYGISATFFVTTAYIGTNRVFPWDVRDRVSAPLMTWDNLHNLVARGHAIGAHTRNHYRLSELDRPGLEAEILGSGEDIEKRLGISVDTFAYPFGRLEHFNAAAEDIVKSKYKLCCTSIRGENGAALLNLHRLRRSSVQQWWGHDDFRAEIRGAFDFIENLRH